MHKINNAFEKKNASASVYQSSLDWESLSFSISGRGEAFFLHRPFLTKTIVSRDRDFFIAALCWNTAATLTVADSKRLLKR